MFLSFHQEMVHTTLSCLKQNNSPPHHLQQATVPEDQPSLLHVLRSKLTLPTNYRNKTKLLISSTSHLLTHQDLAGQQLSHHQGIPLPSPSHPEEHPVPQIGSFPAGLSTATPRARRHKSALTSLRPVHPPICRTELADFERMCFKFRCL